MEQLCKSLLALLLLNSCDSLPPITLNNREAEERQYLEREPEVAWAIRQAQVPQDASWHYGGSIARIHDPQSGEPVGWQFGVSFTHSIPFVARKNPQVLIRATEP